MKGFESLRIKSAVKHRTAQNFFFDHLTTMQIGQCVPLGVIDMVPGDNFNRVDYNVFSRLAPLVKPTYGRMFFKVVKAFVPFNTIAADAEAWLAGKTTWEGYIPKSRYFTFNVLVSLFRTPINGLATTTGATQANCDFVTVNTSGVTEYYIFTNKGKYFYTILCALGYAFPDGVDLQSGSAWMVNEANKQFSALPLLSFMKLYNDYLSQSQRYNTSVLSNILNAIKYGKAYSGIWNESTGALLSGGILAMLNAVLVNYENDYFVSAWQSPNSPLSGVENVTPINTPGSNVPIADTNTDVVAGLSVTGGIASLPQRALDYLKSFADWVRRNNYSGSKPVQQLFSRFGIKSSDAKSHYADIIGVDTFPIQVGDVTATADSTNIPLGDYAGKAIVAGEGSLSYKSNDHGILFILGFITVSPFNPYGFNKRVLRVEPLDYYNPEFDGLGAEAISVGEFYADPIDETRTVLDSNVFGFTERYNSYRFMRDVISGEFRNFHPNGDMNVWHLGRNLSSVRNAGYLLAQNSAVNTLSPTDSEYNRIFSNFTGDVDHFYLTCKFKISAVRPMKNLNQVVDLGEGDTVVPRNGQTIS